MSTEVEPSGPPTSGVEKAIETWRFRRFARQGAIILFLGLIAVTCLAPVPAPSQSIQSPQIPSNQTSVRRLPDDLADETQNPSLTPRQKQGIMHANFVKTKSDAAELAALAKELREELNKPNVNTASLEVVNRAERIEKLAKKIREEMKGF